MKLSLFCLLAASVCLCGAGLDLPGTFRNAGDDGVPEGWYRNQHRAYQPFARYEILSEKGKNYLRVTDIRASEGFCLGTEKRFPARAGDTVVVSAQVRGRGTGWFELQAFSDARAWTGLISPKSRFKLEDKWKAVTFRMQVADIGKVRTGRIMLTFGAFPGKDTSMMIGDIKADLQVAKYRGSLVFPLSWKVFPEISPKFRPTSQVLESMPEKLAGKSGTVRHLQAGMLDFAEVTGRQKEGLCSWAFAELDAPFDCDYTIGAGADWWMTYYVNGKIVLDTSVCGNTKYPYAIDNHVKTVQLKKGRNILAVRFVAGRNSSVMMLGGPNELRKIVRNFAVRKTLREDGYEEASVKRPGNPELIQDNPTPGLLTLTGQAVYRTDRSLTFDLKPNQYRMPADKDSFFATGLRIQNFGRKARRDSTLRIVFASAGRKAFWTIAHKASADKIECSFSEDGRPGQKMFYDYRLLPADFHVFAGKDGAVQLQIFSLVDSSVQKCNAESDFFRRLSAREFRTWMEFRSDCGTTAELTADNYMTGIGEEKVESNAVPFHIELEKTFDPVKKGWKLVFADEFNGDKVDRSKWFSYRDPQGKFSSVDGKGHLLIKADFDSTGRELDTSDLRSKEAFKYGYFEARVKFTHQPGWWAAFWLYGMYDYNPMMNGFEIDIFEDYYNRRESVDKSVAGVLDHNLHTFVSGSTKSWNYHSTLPGSLDDWYVIGCKWTPFEISYYLNGKQLAGTGNSCVYDTVTYDAVNHAACITPLHAIVSGQIMGKSWFAYDKSKGKYPEYYKVDYVRVYEYPNADAPSVSWKNKDDQFWVPEGTVLKFDAEVRPSPVAKSPIKTVYLFDNGHLIAWKSKAPYSFEIPFTPEFYDKTAYMKPGRQGAKSPFRNVLHVFSVMAQDEAGKVAHSDTVMKFVRPAPSRPYEGKAAVLPGKIQLGRYDEGGSTVAYWDSTRGNRADSSFRKGDDVDVRGNIISHIGCGEWLNYTVDVRQTGIYDAEILYGSVRFEDQSILLFLDGRPLGTMYLKGTGSRKCTGRTRLEGMRLEKGRHVLMVMMMGRFNLGELKFEMKKQRAVYRQTIPWKVNFDESLMPDYTLPDPLRCQDGVEVRTAAEWNNRRRPELLQLFQDYMYGAIPPRPDQVKSQILSEKRDALDGLAVRREVRLTFSMKDGRSHHADILYYLPASAKEKVPVFVGLTFGGNHVISPETDIRITGLAYGDRGDFIRTRGAQQRRFPLKKILQRGYAIAVASYHDFFPDWREGWEKSMFRLYPGLIQERKTPVCFGSQPLPVQWTVFPEVNAMFLPPEKELHSIPASLDGRKGRTAVLKDGTLNFAEFTGRQEERLCSWAFAELNVPAAGKYTLGAGADWWMAVYVNGKIVIDTLAGGNEIDEVTCSDHVATVNLRKGKNILAIRFIAGRASSNLRLGGPAELRRLAAAGIYRGPVSRPAGCSSIGAWAWGLSRILDYMETVPEVDGRRAAVFGHSRLGKTALWAGAQDSRFGLVCVNDSGCGGAALSRRLFGETLFGMFGQSNIGKWWFTDTMKERALYPEKLPVDQHMLIALVAPRAVAVHSATEDIWADPKGEYLSAYHAGPVYRLFGKEPLQSAVQPPPETPVGTDVSYLLRTGRHDLLLQDWEHYLDMADRVFKK